MGLIRLIFKATSTSQSLLAQPKPISILYTVDFTKHCINSLQLPQLLAQKIYILTLKLLLLLLTPGYGQVIMNHKQVHKVHLTDYTITWACEVPKIIKIHKTWMTHQGT